MTDTQRNIRFKFLGKPQVGSVRKNARFGGCRVKDLGGVRNV